MTNVLTNVASVDFYFVLSTECVYDYECLFFKLTPNGRFVCAFIYVQN